MSEGSSVSTVTAESPGGVYFAVLVPHVVLRIVVNFVEGLRR